MFIEFLFAATLDMSMPEFQPQEDISGNVIVSEVDDVSGEFIAEVVPLNEIPIEKTSDLLLLGLSQEEDPTDEVMLRAIETNVVEPSILSNFRIRNGALQYHSGDNVYYVYVTEGIEYTLYEFEDTFNTSPNLNNGTSVTSHVLSDTFTPSENCYIVRSNLSFYVTYNTGEPDPEPDISGNEPGGDVSGDDVSGDDVSGNSPSGDVSGGDNENVSIDLSNVESKLDNVIVLQRSILMTLLITFLFPIIKSCVNLLKGGKNV